MQLTSHTDYALRLLIYLMSNPGRNVSTREMAAAYGISLNHLTKVAKALVNGGWLLSTRGGGGGLTLAGHTPDATLGDIVRYTESMVIAECFTPKSNTCAIAGVCQLKPVLYRARQAFFNVLDEVTVAQISRNPMELNQIFGRGLTATDDPKRSVRRGDSRGAHGDHA